MSQTLVKCTRLNFEFTIFPIRYFLLQHPATHLVKTVEIQVAKNHLVFLVERGEEGFKSFKLLIQVQVTTFESRIWAAPLLQFIVDHIVCEVLLQLIFETWWNIVEDLLCYRRSVTAVALGTLLQQFGFGRLSIVQDAVLAWNFRENTLKQRLGSFFVFF